MFNKVLFNKILSNQKTKITLSIYISLLLSLSFISSAQTNSSELFPMVNGTQVQILSSDFLTFIAGGQILEGGLELHAKLTPTQNVQLIFSNAQTGEVGILPAVVNFAGDDLLIPVTTSIGRTQSGTVSYISLRNWLFTTKGITLRTANY